MRISEQPISKPSKKTVLLYKIYSVIMYVCWVVILLFFGFFGIYRTYAYPIKYKNEIFLAADEFGLERALILAVIKEESGFNSSALSSAGAVGLMQIKEETGKYIADKMGIEQYELSDAKTNIRFGCYYLKYLSKKFKETSTVLAAYNAGEGNVSLWLGDSEFSPDGIRLTKIPFKETEEYIKKIEKSFAKYKKLYGNILDKL